MRHSALRNWLLWPSKERSWRRSGVPDGFSDGAATAATTAAAATAFVLPCLPALLLLALPPAFAFLLDLPLFAWAVWLPLLAEVWVVLWCVVAPAGATASVVINTASAIFVLIILNSLVDKVARRTGPKRRRLSLIRRFERIRFVTGRLLSHSFLQHVQHIGGRHAARHVAAFEQTVGQVALVLVQVDNSFLDRVARHQPVDGHRPQLAHAVGAVRGLVFHRRIPPRVHVDHVVGGGQVDADAARFQADEEHLT